MNRSTYPSKRSMDNFGISLSIPTNILIISPIIINSFNFIQNSSPTQIPPFPYPIFLKQHQIFFYHNRIVLYNSSISNMGNANCHLQIGNNLCQQFITTPTPNLENIQNDEPLTNLSNRIHQHFAQSITASRNLMQEHYKHTPPPIQPKENINPKPTQVTTICEKPQIKTQIAEQNLLGPVFEVLTRMKVKKPTFQMIQIDAQKFLKTKQTPITMDYDLICEIGKGGFGQVYRAKQKKSGQIRAIKKINKNSLNSQQKLQLANQFQILGKLDHPNIIKLYDIYDTKNDLFVVTELCEGGDLLKYVNSTRMTQKIMRNVMVQLISAVKYMHSFKILHRDIKLENIVIVKNLSNDHSHEIDIKLIDFGISLNLNKISYQNNIQPLGTPLYMAPQTLNNKLGLQADMWSCGIALYMMVTRKMPYKYQSDNQLLHKIKKGEIIRNNLQKLSLDLKVFVMQLLQFSPLARFSASRALNNPWLRKQSHKPSLTASTRLKAARNLLDYDAKNNLVSIIEAYLIYKKVNQDERQRLASIFEEIDEDKSGIIQIDQLKKFYSENSEHYEAEEVQELLGVMDKNKSGKIDFNEFITAMCDRRALFQKQALQEAFDFFDKDKSGQISKKQLQQILEGIQHEQIEYLFSQLDKNNDSKISKKQFMSYLGKYS